MFVTIFSHVFQSHPITKHQTFISARLCNRWQIPSKLTFFLHFIEERVGQNYHASVLWFKHKCQSVTLIKDYIMKQKSTHFWEQESTTLAFNYLSGHNSRSGGDTSSFLTLPERIIPLTSYDVILRVGVSQNLSFKTLKPQRLIKYALLQLCPTRGPVEGFVRLSLGFLSRISSLHTDHLALFWYS